MKKWNYSVCPYCGTTLQANNDVGAVAVEKEPEFGPPLQHAHTLERCRNATYAKVLEVRKELCNMVDEFRLQRNNAYDLLTKSQRAIVNSKMKKRAERRRRMGL